MTSPAPTPEPTSVVIGVDVGGTKIAAVAFAVESGVETATPVILDSRRAPTPSDSTELVSVITELTVALATERSLRAIGLGLAGFIDATGIARQAPNVPALVDVDLPAALGRRFDVPVVVDNDANCAAWAARHEVVPTATEVVVVAIGTGIGGGLIVDGRLVRGAHGFAGEPGHMVISPGGPPCVCGQAGCWETLASGSALDRAAVATLGPGADGASLFVAAAANDPAASRALDAYCDWLALGIANLVNLLDPSTVLITGGIAAQGNALIDRLRPALHRLPTVFTGRTVDVRTVGSGPDSAAIGAGLIARRALEPTWSS